MYRHCGKVGISDGDYHHSLFGLLLAWSSTTRFTRAYFRSCWNLRRMQIHCEKKISSDGDYLHSLFGLLKNGVSQYGVQELISALVLSLEE